jgi:arginyl-tRNA synthetase
MKSTLDILEQRIRAVMAEVTGQRGCSALVKPATDPKFGDYQVNGVMPLAKQLKTNPRKLAEQIVAELIKKSSIENQVSSIETAGPGFINLRLKPDFVADSVLQVTKDPDRLGIETTNNPKTIVVDFSGPNIAKQMHVGHLRSTIIGDCICRLLELEGHNVIRQNHIGDWGTQFGMLIAYYNWIMTSGPMPEIMNLPDKDSFLADMEEFYRRAKTLFDKSRDFQESARSYVVLLQGGEPEVLENWKYLVNESLRHCEEVYNLLDVMLKRSDVRGESFYNDKLPEVVSELKGKGLAVESEGAVCVFPDKEKFKDKEGKPLPVIVQKSDGAFLYATTDLAAIRYRVGELKADRLIYVTDSRQSLHFEMVFAVARMAGWAKPETELVHVTFGSVLGEDGKPLKTRSGENVKLKELLDEAVTRARKIVDEKNPDLPDADKAKIAQAVGIGAVKYADYTNNRTSDYIFSFNKMLAMEGNTAPYMQYAYARVQSIRRKGEQRGIEVNKELADLKIVSLVEPSELDLAKHLIRYGEAVEAAVADYRPNYLTSYLYDLAQKFSVFYTNCPVLDAGPDKRPTRLLLCDLTASIIEHGLHDLLGIEVIEQM